MSDNAVEVLKCPGMEKEPFRNSEQKEEKMDITLKLFFEIKDAELFGGIGKAGYIEAGMEISGENLEQVNLRQYAEEQRKGIAQMCGVMETKVRIIPEKQYKICVEEEDSTSVMVNVVQREENMLQKPLHEVSAGRCRAENTCGWERCCMECREKEDCTVRCRGSRGKWKCPEECRYYTKMNVFEKMIEEIEEVFKENTENIEDANGVHHFVIDSFTVRLLAEKIIHDYGFKICSEIRNEKN